ncbi:MAG: NAD(P)/FAD-dependent oxidoreductase [Anaerolineae bacterium]|nr:NAD(P)/FAD-dependent oxidoreductase [Anaerolineae bacterium]MCB9108659.1 NAD(P)/FAD-dependent oxidoreductase [Anaerolineales bacterium]
MTTHIAVIGAGPAGVAAVNAAAEAGARVTLIGAEPPGGRAGWHSLLPSKVLLTAADSRGLTHHFQNLGLGSVGPNPDIEVMVQRIHALSQAWSDRQSADLTQRGVQFLKGAAAFQDSRHLRITPAEGSSTDLEADAIIIASGSVPMFPPNLKPDGGRIIAPRFVGKMRHLPQSIIVVGGGVTGAEFAYAFNRLGVNVTWLVDEFGVLPPFDREAVGVFTETLSARNVIRHEGVAADTAVAGDDGVTVTLRDGRAVQADMAFIAIGRRPDIAGLNLSAAGLPEDPRRGIVVDDYGRSSIPHIYAAGDVSGLPMTANKAMAQGYIAGRHAAGAPVDPYQADTTVEAVYTDPQVAQVGLSESAAHEAGHSVRIRRLDYGANLKAMLLNETAGFVKLIADADDNRLLGAAAVGDHATNMLTPAALGIRLGARVDDLAALFAAHPGLGELTFAAARAADSPAGS